MEQKAEEGEIHPFFSASPLELGYLIFSCLQTGIYVISFSGSQAFGVRLLHYWFYWFSSLQMASHGTSQPP